MFEGGGSATSRRLPFRFQVQGGVGRLALEDLVVGLVTIDKLELEVTELGTDPGVAPAERFQRRRTQLRALSVRVAQAALDERVAQVGKSLAALGITQLSARLADGYVSVRARAADGLAAADLSFHVELVSSGAQLRALASAIRVHGHLPTPGPVIADRLLVAITGAGGAGDAPSTEHPYSRGLCDVELDLVGALLWQVLPPSGWRLPAVTDIELTHIRVARGAIEVGYGPTGARAGELGVGKHTHQLAAAHDLMHSVDEQLRSGQLEDAMRGYRALLASGGPDQPVVLERILTLAVARPAWLGGGLELARQALGRWPRFAPAHAALASITLAQGDAREAARHLEDGARIAGAGGDDDQAALAALAAARLLRVLDPRAATQLYQLALEHDPSSTEAADALADRLADEQRWSELVRLVRTRTAIADAPRAVELHLRLADVFVHQLGDPAAAQRELALARELAPDDPAVHEMTAEILVASDPGGAIAAWREVARLAEARGDHRTCARGFARLGELLAIAEGATSGAAEDAWRRSLELDPLQADALVGLASAAVERNDHAIAAELYERLRSLGLPQAVAARHELALARSLVALGRTDDARASLRRATLAGGETAALAHARLAEIADAALDRDHAAAELDTAIAALVELADASPPDVDRLCARAAEIAVARAMLLDRNGQPGAAGADWQRAHALAQKAAPEIARDAARTLLARSGDDAALERRWIDAVLATRPPPAERAALLVRRADVRRRERVPDLAAALADLHEAVELAEQIEPGARIADEPAADTDLRRRAYQLEAELFAQSGDRRSRAQALAAIAKLAERAADRVASETAAAAAWLAADEPAAALPHGARAHAQLSSAAEIPAALRREVRVTLGEAAWRQRAWPDVIRAYHGLLDDPGPEAHRLATYRFRLAVAADRAGDQGTALGALRPLISDPESTRGASPELRAHALRLFADLAERAGELATSAMALEAFAAIGSDGSGTARADAVYRAGELFRRAERDDDAIRCFETALRISESHLPALEALEAAWRERGDLERVAVILGRKVAATARHPARQKPLLSRLGDLQDQLHRPEVALATHQRALEIDPMWRPSLRYVTLGLRDSGQVVAAAGGLAQLAGELHGDHGVDLAIVTRERQIAAEALAQLIARLDDAQVEAVRAVALPALERAALDNAGVAAGLLRLRGEAAAAVTLHSEADTQSGRIAAAPGGALSLREAAARARAAGKLDEAFATLETANHVSPGDVHVLRELVEIATELRDHTAAARHLAALALALTGSRRGDALLELADVYYDRLEDAARGREAMRKAAEAFGSGARRDATLRMLATEAASHLAWDVAVESLLAIPVEKRTQADFTSVATALLRAGRDADALAAIEAATTARRFDDDGELLRMIQLEIQRKTDLARALEGRAASASAQDAEALLDEAQQLRSAIGQPGNQPLRDLSAPEGEAHKSDTAPWPLRTKTKPGVPNRQVPPAPAGSRARPTRPPPLPGSAASDAGRSSPAVALPTAAPATGSSPSIAIPGAAPATGSSSGDAALEAVETRSPGLASPEPTRSSPGLAVPKPPAGEAPERAHEAPAAAEAAAPRAEPAATSDTTGERPAVPPTPAAAKSPSRDALPQSTIGRIKLVPRVVARTGTRPGMGVLRPQRPARPAAPAPVEDAVEDASGEWQSVSNPALKSGPWLAPPRPSASLSASLRPAPETHLEPPEADEPAPPAPTPPIDVEPDAEVRIVEPSPPAAPAEPAPVAAISADQPSPPAPTIEPAAITEIGADEPAPAAAVSADEPSPPASPIEPAPVAEEPPAAPSVESRLFPPAPAPLFAPPPDRVELALPAPELATEPAEPEPAEPEPEPDHAAPSVTITGTPEETALAVLLAAASADRERLFAARRTDPDDPAVLLALLAHLGDREPVVRRELLDEAMRTSHGRALAIALHELAVLAREAREASRATALWTRAYETDPTYPPVWMPLADALAAADDYATARELYDAIARSDAYDSTRRAFAAERAEALGRDDSIVSGEIKARGTADLEEARQLAASEDWPGAIDAAERAAAARPDDPAILEVLETIYLASGNVTAASEAIGRQLMLVDDAAARAALWRRRARMYRDALGRDAEVYRCLQEAHACAPADPDVAYQLRTAAMVRGDWQLAAQLLYREIAAAANPRDRGALHLELAMVYEERLDDAAQAQANYEQALAFDPTIPAVKLPLARRYEALGKTSDAARLYEEAASHARPADRAGLLEAAARCRQAAAEAAEPDVAAQLDRAEAAGDLDAALELAHQLWRTEPGHPAAFRTLASTYRASGDLAALTELTSQRARHAETPDERATAWLEVARLAEDMSALDQAARAYDLALIEDPGHLGALDARGALAFRLSDFATADLIYRDLGSGESVLGDDELALRRSIIAEQLGRDSEALQLAEVAASLSPGRRDLRLRVQELATRMGELTTALTAARSVLELVPLDDDEAQLTAQLALVELLREAGQLDEAVAQLERILRDHPMHASAIEGLAQVHAARGDWPAATRYLYQLVPLAPTPGQRADRLYQLGEAVLVHVNDIDRADDVFLRASDLDPSHVPTLRRLLDVYWRADDPGGIVEVATELADKGALVNGPIPNAALGRALIAAALVGDVELTQQLQTALGDDTPRRIADALGELVGRTGRLQLGTASTAIAELARRGYLDLAKLRAAMASTPAANTL